MNLILTGSRGVGKTTVCNATADLARDLQHSVGGIVCPGLFDAGGQKTGFDALDLASGDRWPLGRIGAAESGPRIGPFTLSGTGLAKSLAAMRTVCSVPPELIFVDEIGPLELIRGEGFAPVLATLPLDGPGHLLVVVRPSMVSVFMQTVDRRDWMVFAAREDNRQSFPRRISEVLWPGD